MKMTLRNLLPGVVAATLMLCAAVAAQQSSNRVIVKAGHLLDVKSGDTLANRAIVIEGDKIASVIAAGDLKTSPGDTVIDLSHATVLPGLIDAHTHLTFNPSSSRGANRRPQRARHFGSRNHHRAQRRRTWL